MQRADRAPVSEELIPGSDKLFLFFGGIAGAIGMPPFEFYRASRILRHSRIFLRDLDQAWYQRGLPTIGGDVFAVGDYLRGRIRESGASDVCFVGNSMGGFAALLFCSMLRQGKVVAFAPQTFVSRDKRELHGDRRWAPQIEMLHRARKESDVHDLRAWIEARFPEMPARVYVSSEDVLDLRHADELAGFPNIEIHRIPGSGHALVTQLRDEGLLARILSF